MKYSDTISKLHETSPVEPLVKRLKAVNKIIVHGGKCPDGKASAMILRQAYGDQVPIEFVNHGREKDALVPEPGMLFCDISPEKNWEAFLEAGALVLDHHKGVKHICQAFVEAGQGAFADEVEHPGVSGATLAYEYVFKPLMLEEIPSLMDSIDTGSVCELGRLAGVRDTWRTKHPEWLEACKRAEAVSWWPNENLLDAEATDWASMFEIGDVLWQKKLKTAEKVGEKAFRFTSVQGTRVALFQGMRLSSDVAEYLDHDPVGVDLIVGYDLFVEDGILKQGFSTRSHTGYDCKAMAQAHGGGGHTAAAGFTVPLTMSRSPNPYKVVETVINSYQGSWMAKFRKMFL